MTADKRFNGKAGECSRKSATKKAIESLDEAAIMSSNKMAVIGIDEDF